MAERRRWDPFLASVFFVLGFSVVFALVGALLQSVLADSGYVIQTWLGRIGGVVIIFFGLYLIGLLDIPFLKQEHKIQVKRRFNSRHLTSFVFGAAFAVGWSPCVGAILGAILTLAVSQPSLAFFLLLAYSLGLGIPFLIVGFFTNEAQRFIRKAGKWVHYVNKSFGVVLILLGILVFTNQLSRIASFEFASNVLIGLDAGGIGLQGGLSLGIAFVAGILSFLSPCVLPLIPGFLSYLATTVVKDEE